MTWCSSIRAECVAAAIAAESYHGAQFALASLPAAVSVLTCVEIVPAGVAVPANVNSKTPRNSARRAYANLTLPNLLSEAQTPRQFGCAKLKVHDQLFQLTMTYLSGACSSPGMLTERLGQCSAQRTQLGLFEGAHPHRPSRWKRVNRSWSALPRDHAHCGSRLPTVLNAASTTVTAHTRNESVYSCPTAMRLWCSNLPMHAYCPVSLNGR